MGDGIGKEAVLGGMTVHSTQTKSDTPRTNLTLTSFTVPLPTKLLTSHLYLYIIICNTNG